MRIIKTQKSRRSISFSPADGAALHIPTSWGALTQTQLRYVLWLMTQYNNMDMIKTMVLVRVCGIHIIRKTEMGWLCRNRGPFWRRHRFFLRSMTVASMLQYLNFIDKRDDPDIRLDTLSHGRYHARNAQLHGVAFGDYIALENYYNGYLQSKEDECLDAMAHILYERHYNGRTTPMTVRRLSHIERLSVLLWFGASKSILAKSFPDFFRPVDGEPANMIDIMNAEIRALTGGDITLEQQVKDTDCWRALTELNAKTKEISEFNTKYGK